MKKVVVSPPVSEQPDSIDQDVLFDYFYTKFKRARTEETLDLMYKGAVNAAKKKPEGKGRFSALLAIERALDRCQQDFDGTYIGMTRKVNHALKDAASQSSEKYDPMEQLRILLSANP